MPVLLLAALLLLFPAVCGAVDSIVLETGATIECKIIRQTGEEIVYEKDGKTVTLRKSDVRSIDLDTDIDKYFKAAENADSAEKKILYLTKSIQNFPDRDANKLTLAKVYINENMLDKADDVLRGHDTPPYRMLSALVLLRRGDRAGAERMLSSVDRSALDKPAQVNAAIITAFVRLDAGDITGAMAAVNEGKTLDREFAKRFESFSSKERTADFEKRLVAARDTKAAEETAKKKKADEDADKERIASQTRKFLSSIDLGIRIPCSFNTIFTASTGMWMGISFGGGLSAGVSLLENYLWGGSRISLEASAVCGDNETMLPSAYYAEGSFIRQLDIRWGVNLCLWITRNIFAGGGFSVASIFAGAQGNASYSSRLTNTMLGNDLHASFLIGYSFALTPALAIPIACRIEYILPVNLPTSKPFEFGITTGITWKLGV